jgi:hypothetical protein
MPASLYEIVMLPDGDFALQRTDDTDEPLIRISFSDEAKGFLQDASLDVAKAMIDAGIEVVEQIGDESSLDTSGELIPKDRVLH